MIEAFGFSKVENAKASCVQTCCNMVTKTTTILPAKFPQEGHATNHDHRVNATIHEQST